MRICLASGCAAIASMALVGCASAASAPTPPATHGAQLSVAPQSVIASPSHPHRPDICRSKDLTATHHPGEGTGSQEYSLISLRNISGSTCTLNGWPTVRLLNHAHQSIGPAAGHHFGVAPKLVRLGPGRRAEITISVGSVAVPTAVDCRQQAAMTIAITLPGGAALTVPARIQVCSRETGLATGPVEPGSSLAPV